MRVIDNVDVCVTCVTDKPPALPLREELPSLGVELVYNAKGTGMRGVRRKYRDAKASQKATTKLKEGRVARVKKTIGRKLGLRPPTDSSGRIPKKLALSYDSYRRTALRSPGSSVASSCEKTVDSDSISSFASSAASAGRLHQQQVDDNPALDDHSSLDPAEEAADSADVALEARQPAENEPMYSEAEGGEQKWYETYEDAELDLSYPFDSRQAQEDDAFAESVDGSEGAHTFAALDEINSPSKDDYSPHQCLGEILDEWNKSFRKMCCLGLLLDIKEEREYSLTMSQDSDMKMLRIRKDLQREQERSQILLGMLEDDFSEPTAKMGTSKAKAQRPGPISHGMTTKGEGTALVRLSPHENDLFDLISQVDSLPEDVKDLIDAKPALVQAIDSKTGQMPLHALCDRGLPLRSLGFGNQNEYQEDTAEAEMDSKARDLMNDLLNDITTFRVMLKVVAWAHVDACCIPDKKADLPVHILARRLIEWKNWWDNDDLQEMCYPTNIINEARTTTLYRTMSECIEVVLRPIASKRMLCRARGSEGMLPVHIAALFGASYDTLRLVLEEYKEGAHIPCKLKDPKKNVELQLLPLELFERRKKEHKYCEDAENNDYSDSSSTGIQWTSSTLENGRISEDLNRKSDMIFACNPNITPHRFDQARLKRIESMIRTEAKQKPDHGNEEGKLSIAVKTVWVFMCTHNNESDADDNYAENVKHIVDDLDSVALLKLIALHDEDGRELLEVANPICSEAIKASLQRAVHEQDSKSPSLSSGSVQNRAKISQGSQVDSAKAVRENGLEKKSILKNGKAASKSRSHTKPSEEIGRLCRKVFGVKEDGFPTSFVILPYRLKQEKDGALTLASPKDAELAFKFAQSLITLTEYPALLHTLENKFRSPRRGGCETRPRSEITRRNKQDIENNILVFLSLYTSNIGYLYLLDERSGVPQMKGPTVSISAYPIIVTNAYATAEKLLPLMQMGMTLMRGDIALKVLGQVISFGSESMSPPSWLGASQEIVTLLYSSKSEKDLNGHERGKFDELLDNLTEYASTMSAHIQNHGVGFQDGSEWVIELSFLKILLEKFDGRRTYAGLQAVRKNGVIWTCKIEEEDEVGEAQPQKERPLEFHFTYDPIIHKSVSCQYDDTSSEVSSITSARTPMDDNFIGQIPLTDHGIPEVHVQQKKNEQFVETTEREEDDTKHLFGAEQQIGASYDIVENYNPWSGLRCDDDDTSSAVSSITCSKAAMDGVGMEQTEQEDSKQPLGAEQQVEANCEEVEGYNPWSGLRSDDRLSEALSISSAKIPVDNDLVPLTDHVIPDAVQTLSTGPSKKRRTETSLSASELVSRESGGEEDPSQLTPRDEVVIGNSNPVEERHEQRESEEDKTGEGEISYNRCNDQPSGLSNNKSAKVDDAVVGHKILLAARRIPELVQTLSGGHDEEEEPTEEALGFIEVGTDERDDHAIFQPTADEVIDHDRMSSDSNKEARDDEGNGRQNKHARFVEQAGQEDKEHTIASEPNDAHSDSLESEETDLLEILGFDIFESATGMPHGTDMLKSTKTELRFDDDLDHFESARMEFKSDTDVFHSARMVQQQSSNSQGKSMVGEEDSLQQTNHSDTSGCDPQTVREQILAPEIEKHDGTDVMSALIELRPNNDLFESARMDFEPDSDVFHSPPMVQQPSICQAERPHFDDKADSTFLSSSQQTDTSDTSGCNAQVMRKQIPTAIPAHSIIRKVKFVLLDPREDNDIEDSDNEIVGLSVLDEAENVIKTEIIMNAKELLKFVKDSKKMEKEIAKKVVQIKELEEATVAVDSMRKEEFEGKENIIENLSSKLYVYEDEQHSKTEGIDKANEDTVAVGDTIELTLVLPEGCEGTDLLQENSVHKEVQAGMVACLYDLQHKSLAKDIELERLKLDLHTREVELTQDKEKEINHLRKQLMDKAIQIQEFEEKLERYIKPKDESISSEGSTY